MNLRLLKTVLCFLVLSNQSLLFSSQKFSSHSFLEEKSELIEINSLKQINKYVEDNSLVVFDIDLTLIQEYLNDLQGKKHVFEAGLYYLMSDFIKKKAIAKIFPRIWTAVMEDFKRINRKDLLKILLKKIKFNINEKMKILWKKIEPKIGYQPMESGIPQIISCFQKRGIRVLAFTAREWSMNEGTQEDLKNLGVDFSLSFLSTKTFIKKPLGRSYGYGFDRGVISLIRGKEFDQKTQKGPILLRFFKQVNYKPENLIFIDNRRDNVLDVLNSLRSNNIPVVGLWYKFKGYIENPVLHGSEVGILNRYIGKNWWKLSLNVKDLISSIKRALQENKSKIIEPEPRLVNV